MITFTLGRFHFLTQILLLTFSILNVIVKQVTNFIVFFNAHWVSFIAFFIIVLFFIEFTNHEWVIHPFDVPPSLERQGYTGRVVAFKLRNYMFELRDYMNNIDKLKSSDKNYLKREALLQALDEVVPKSQVVKESKSDITIPAMGFSLGSFVLYMRDLLGVESRYIKGNIVLNGESESKNEFYLTIWVGSKSIEIKDKEPEFLIKRAAEYVLEVLEPLTISMNYCVERNSKSLGHMVQDSFEKQSILDKKAIQVLKACYFSTQGEYRSALEILDEVEGQENLGAFRAWIQANQGDVLGEVTPPQNIVTSEDKIPTKKKKEKINDTDWTSYSPSEYSEIVDSVRELNHELKILQNTPHQIVGYEATKLEGDTSSDTSEYTLYTLSEKEESLVELAVEYEEPVTDTEKEEYGKAIEQYREAVATYEKTSKSSKNLGWIYGNWGDTLLHLGKFEEAIDKYEKAIKVNPDYSYAYGNECVALNKLERYMEAVNKCKKALKLNLDLHWVYKELGDALVGIGNYDEAIEKYSKFYGKNKTNYLYYYKLGGVYLAEGRYQDAINEYDKALKIKEEHFESRAKYAEALAKLGETLAKSNVKKANEKYEGANIEYQKAEKLMKGVGNSNFYLSWGKVLKNMGKCNESAEKYKKALELVPKELGKAKEAVEKEAKNSFEKCIEK